MRSLSISAGGQLFHVSEEMGTLQGQRVLTVKNGAVARGAESQVGAGGTRDSTTTFSGTPNLQLLPARPRRQLARRAEVRQFLADVDVVHRRGVELHQRDKRLLRVHVPQAAGMVVVVHGI